MKKLRARELRRIASLAGVAALSVGVAACGSSSSGGSSSGGSSSGSSKAAIHLGGILGLSGVAASYGIAIQQGEDLALSQVNAAGGVSGRQVQITEKNSNYTPSTASAAFRSLAADSSNLAILGPNDSTDGAATTKLANAEGIVQVVQGAAAAWPLPFGKNVFLLPASNTDEIDAAVKAAVEANPSIKSVAILYASDESYAVSAVKAFQAAASQNGLTVKTTQKFVSTAQDYSSQLTSIKDSGAQAVFVSAVAANLGPMLVQAQNLGVKATWVGDAGATDPSWGKTAGPAGNGVITALPFLPTAGGPKVKAFVTAFKKKYNTVPSLYNAYGYDAAETIVDAMDNVKGSLTRTAIQQAMAKITHTGVTGTYHWPNGSGLTSRTGLTVVKMENGSFVPDN